MGLTGEVTLRVAFDFGISDRIVESSDEPPGSDGTTESSDESG
jgi:hypothetical protein